MGAQDSIAAVVPLFAGIAEESVRRLSARATERRFRPGDTLFDHGTSASEVLAVVAGRIKIWRSLENGVAMTLGFVGGGDFIGLTGALAGLPRRSEATALTPVTTLAWHASALVAEMAHDPRLGMNVNRLMAGYLRAVTDRLEELAAPSPDRRLARVLVGLARDGGGRADRWPVPIDVRQSDLAELARTTVPTVSRCLTRWRAAGVVEARRGRLRVLDRARLVEIGRDAG